MLFDLLKFLLVQFWTANIFIAYNIIECSYLNSITLVFNLHSDKCPLQYSILELRLSQLFATLTRHKKYVDYINGRHKLLMKISLILALMSRLSVCKLFLDVYNCLLLIYGAAYNTYSRNVLIIGIRYKC